MSSATVPMGAAAPIAKLTKEVSSSSSGLIFIIIVLGLAIIYLFIRYRNLETQIGQNKQPQDDSFVSNAIEKYLANPENRPHLLHNILPYLPHAASPKKSTNKSKPGVIGESKKKSTTKLPDVKMHSSPLGFGMPSLGLFDGGFLFPQQLLQGGGQMLFQTTIEDEETAATGFATTAPPSASRETNDANSTGTGTGTTAAATAAAAAPPKIIEDTTKPKDPPAPKESTNKDSAVPPTSGTKLTSINENEVLLAPTPQ
jgi:hypothetical protein